MLFMLFILLILLMLSVPFLVFHFLFVVGFILLIVMVLWLFVLLLMILFILLLMMLFMLLLMMFFILRLVLLVMLSFILLVLLLFILPLLIILLPAILSFNILLLTLLLHILDPHRFCPLLMIAALLILHSLGGLIIPRMHPTLINIIDHLLHMVLPTLILIVNLFVVFRNNLPLILVHGLLAFIHHLFSLLVI
jgi:hypothetical protein